jgi:telomere length regulation protein
LQELVIREGSNGAEAESQLQHKTPASLEDALEIVRHQPDYESLISVLVFLSRHETPDSHAPAIKLPGPLSAQLVQVLVSDIVPNYWPLLTEDIHQGKNSGLKLLLYCLSSITGVNAILVRLRAFVQEAKSETAAKTKRPDISLSLGNLLDLLSRVLQGDGWVLEAWRLATSGFAEPSRVRPRVQEIVATLGSGRIISMAAEAEEVAKANDPSKGVDDDIWPADSLKYTQWLGRNIVKLVQSDLGPDETKLPSDLFAKALHLGHPGRIPPQLTLGMH